MSDNNADVGSPEITEVVPVFGIISYEEAVAYYVDWLGFNLDWEWREAPGRPVIMAISRGNVSLMLNEDDKNSMGSWLTLKVTHLHALADEWNARRPHSVTVAVEPPYDIPTVFLTDPFGNRLHFQQPVSAAEEKARQVRAAQMRDYIRERLAGGHPCPTPEEVVAAIGRPIGLAMDVLCAFPEYEEATGRDDA